MGKTVLLVQLDGKIPNLALMRLAAHHRAQGNEVVFRHFAKVPQILAEPATSFDHIYASAIFTRSRPLVDAVKSRWPAALVGGTGSESFITLEDLGIQEPPDYSIYPRYASSLGFTQRGCRLHCGFCVVPKKEGAVRPTATIADIWRGDPYPRHLILLDNDFFGQLHWRDRIAEIQGGAFKVSFNQGINVRVITDEIAAALASVDYRNDQFTRRQLYTAWDNRKDEEAVFKGLRRLVAHGVAPRNILVYMLIGYWSGETAADREYRRARLRSFGAFPYPMPYVRTPELVGFQRWVIGAYDKRISWDAWKVARYQPRNLSLRKLAELDN